MSDIRDKERTGTKRQAGSIGEMSRGMSNTAFSREKGEESVSMREKKRDKRGE